MEEDEFEKDMTPILIKDLGRRYPTEKSKEKKRFGLYQCQYCGKEFEASVTNVTSRTTNSCGCFKKKQIIASNSSHGCAYHPLYHTWKGMKARCTNPKANYYKDYGGRGIQVCERWLDVRNFIEDMYPSYQEDLTLDRIDVSGNYELDNCRWTDANTQMRNTRDINSVNTSGYRGVSFSKRDNMYQSKIYYAGIHKYLGSFQTALEAGKAYETYVRLNNLEHNFTPALTEEEIEELNKKEGKC